MICATPVLLYGTGLLIMFDRYTSAHSTDKLSPVPFFFGIYVNKKCLRTIKNQREMRDLVKLYGESFKLITDNPNLTTDKIPKHLLEAWLSDDVIVIAETEQPYFAVSIFHLIHDEYLCRKGIEIEPASKIIEHRFHIFQYILALESVHRQHPINLHPVRIGDFDNYETPPTFNSTPKNFKELMALTSTLYPLKNKFN